MFERLISLENLFACWQEFRKGKGSKFDVLRFERHLEDNIFALHIELKNQTYRHDPYSTFHIYDPKHRVISKATVRDRLVHHAVFNELYRIFNPRFIYHSYSSRLERGTHLAVQNLASALRKISQNYTHSTFVLKCDIKKFFDSVSHQKLLQMIKNKIKDSQFLWLVEEIARSFSVDNSKKRERELKGLPIGNLTSQIFANIYLNELDQFVKHKLKVKYYFRYADDFTIVHHKENYLRQLTKQIEDFLKLNLNLELHRDKVTIRKLRQGIDFLGYVILPYHMVLRTKTKRRMFKKIYEKQQEYISGQIDEFGFNQSIQSYLGLLEHCNGYSIGNIIKNNFSI